MSLLLSTPEPPTGPLEWPLRSWLGLTLYLALFVLALVLLVRLDRRHPGEEEG